MIITYFIKIFNMHIYRYNTSYLCAILDFMPVKAITASFPASERLLREPSGAYTALFGGAKEGAAENKKYTQKI